MRAVALMLVLIPVLSLPGCRTPMGEGEDPVAATIGSEAIRVHELDAFIKDELLARETRGGNASRLHDLRRDAIDRLVTQRVVEREAERRGVTPPELIRAESEKLGPITEAEVADFYQKNQDRLRGAPLEQVAGRIRQHLEGEREMRVVRALVDAADVQVRLEVPRVQVAAVGPARGPEDAAVTIVEFGDFQCPYCRRAKPVLDEVLERYPDDVRLVYRHLPLESIHPHARPSAEAAECANEQGGFWKFHDRLFENPNALEDADLRRYAGELGLDVARFDECVSSHRFAAKVSADAAAASGIGVRGTPSFVVNGILLFGFQPADAFDRIIRDELGRQPGSPAGDPPPSGEEGPGA